MATGRRTQDLFHRSLVRLLLLAGRLERPFLTAALLRLGIKRTPIGRPGARMRVLVLPKDMFNEDIAESLGRGDDIRVLSMHRQLVKAVGRHYLPPHIDDNNYVGLSDADEAAKQRLRAYWVEVWRHLDRWTRFDAVLTGNFAYYAERELGAALEILNLPFIAIHKESVRSPGYSAFFARVYRERRGPFTGRRILCYNEAERRLEIESGIAEPDRVRVTGMPRMDAIHRLRIEAAGGKRRARAQVLFFAFGPKTTLPVVIRKMSGPPFKRYAEPLEPTLDALSWTELQTRTHQAVLRLAEEMPEIDVVIKTKGVAGDKEEVLMRRTLGSDRLPRNLHLRYGGDPHALILQSDAVCGFNSTALFEAIAADVPVVVPRFGEAARDEMRPYLIDYEDAVEYARSAEDLRARLGRLAIRRHSPGAGLSEPARRVLRRWVCNDDGRAGERVREAVVVEIERARG
jgi:hypothetical protein